MHRSHFVPEILVLLAVLDDLHQLDCEVQRGLWWDDARVALVTVAQVGRDGQGPGLSQAHPRDSKLIALNDLKLSQKKVKKCLQ